MKKKRIRVLTIVPGDEWIELDEDLKQYFYEVDDGQIPVDWVFVKEKFEEVGRVFDETLAVKESRDLIYKGQKI